LKIFADFDLPIMSKGHREVSIMLIKLRHQGSYNRQDGTIRRGLGHQMRWLD